MDKAGGQEGARQGQARCIGCARKVGAGAAWCHGWRAGSRGRQWGTPSCIGSGPGVKVDLGGTRMDLETA